ncbi:MAG: DUF4410 domain-containing protein [Gammaproteobacteria bacterium]|nr:DUF4410 domain-containing protein [Gammaproteobacteria bacterium]
MSHTRLTVVLAGISLLGACGTYSEMTTESGEAPVLPIYSTVVVTDFADATEPKGLDDDEFVAHREQLQVAGRHFADIIAAELRTEGLYETVLRESTDQEALVIGGEITRHVEGDAFARFMIGLGAGSSYFDAIIRFSDNKSGESLGKMIIDKNSWALGGGIASGQTVEGYMNNAANRVSEEIVEARETMRTLEAAKERQAASSD